MMNKTSLRWLLALAIITATSLACSLSVGGPKIPPTVTPVPEEPTQNVEQVVETAVSSTSTPGVIEIKLTDSQMTQFLIEQLNTQTDPILQNPQVHAHDNVIDIYGQVKRSVITGNVKVSLLPTVDDQGIPHLKIDSADFGPVPVPDSLLKSFTNLIDQSMSANTDPSQTGYSVKSIQVFDGYIVINATPK
jgi:uncharacterized protein YpmS